MIKIYDDNLNVDIPDNCDVEDVIKVMEELDEVYKKRSKTFSNLVSVHVDTLIIAFYAMMDQGGKEFDRILHELKTAWDKLTQLQKDKLTTHIEEMIEKEIITDPEIIAWIKTQESIQESDFL